MVMAVAYAPERADIVWLTFDPHAGHEQAGRRPAVVVSPRAYNGKVGLALLCPITAQCKGYPFEVEVPEGLPVSGAVLSDRLKSMDWKARRAVFACRLPRNVMTEILARIRTLTE
jgi:mRNA interferase MazF